METFLAFLFLGTFAAWMIYCGVTEIVIQKKNTYERIKAENAKLKAEIENYRRAELFRKNEEQFNG